MPGAFDLVVDHRSAGKVQLPTGGQTVHAGGFVRRRAMDGTGPAAMVAADVALGPGFVQPARNAPLPHGQVPAPASRAALALALARSFLRR